MNRNWSILVMSTLFSVVGCESSGVGEADGTVTSSEALEESLVEWRIPAQCPGCAQVYTVDISIQSLGVRASVASFQGLSNRFGPKVYVKLGASDDAWLWRIQGMHPNAYQFVKLRNPLDIFRVPELAGVSKAMVVYRESGPELSYNAALSVAGIKNAVAVESAYEGTMAAYGFSRLPAPFGNMDREWEGNNGKKKNVTVLRWMRNKLLSDA